jgi:small subunit ribosomal protein S20
VARSRSSQKSRRRSVRRQERNKGRKTVIKTALRRFEDAADKKDIAAVEKVFREASALMDRSANRRTLHRNTAARRKSRMARRLNALKPAAK